MMNCEKGSEQIVIFPDKEISQSCYLSTFEEYRDLYNKSIENPQQFWTDVSKEYYWRNSPKTVLDGNFDIRKGPIHVKFMSGALTNACYNVLDRNIDRGLGDNIAYYWEGNDGKTKRRITYSELRGEVCKFANGLNALGIKDGDNIAIYMPVSIDCVVAMLACARIGAVHSVIFAGFSAESLADRIIDGKCVLLISADGCYRANKLIALKNVADSALGICSERGYQKIRHIVNKHLNTSNEQLVCANDSSYAWNDQVDIWWNDLLENVPDYCDPVWMDSNHPAFMIYTSGSTGKPKGLLHTMRCFLPCYLLVKYVNDMKSGDVLLSTADMGWLAGQNLSVYGGLANGASIVLLEGAPTYPSPDRLWEIVDRLNVKCLFTSPTAVRALMKFGDHYVKAYKRRSLKVLGTGGETLNQEAWLWLWKVVGDGRCSVFDYYGQSETNTTITSMPGCTPMKPGSASLPFFGVLPAIVDNNNNKIVGPGEGNLVYEKPWPGIAHTILGDHQLFEREYFQKFPGYYWTGDTARRDADGYYWIKGRSVDIMNVCGRLLSAVEVEMAIMEHRAVLEAAVVSAPHPIKAEVPIVFVILNNGYEMTSRLEMELKEIVRNKIGAHAQPHMIFAVSGLPRTSSGKIMRKLLYNIIRNETDFGDISTMADKSILNEIKALKQRLN